MADPTAAAAMVHAAEVRANRAEARADFLEARAAQFEDVARGVPRSETDVLSLWERETPTTARITK